MPLPRPHARPNRPRQDRGTLRPLIAVRVAAVALLAALLAAFAAPAPARADETSPAPSSSPSIFTGPRVTTPAESTRPPLRERPLVLLGAPGLRWSDVDKETTPTLWRLVNEGPVGTLSVRSVLSPTCAVDSWLMISSGRAISDAARQPRCPAPTEPVDGTVPGWAQYVRQGSAEEGDPLPGTLGDVLEEHGRRVAAVGPGAAIVTANSGGGLVGRYVPADRGYGAAFTDALRERPELVVVDLGRIWITPERSTRQDQVRAVELAAREIMPLLPHGSTVLLAGAASSDDTPRLGLIAMSGLDGEGRRLKAGILGSGSSRQSGLLRVPDITATILQLMSLPLPPRADGAPMQVVAQEGASSEEAIQQVADRERATGTVNPLAVWFVGGLILLDAALYVAAWWVLRRLRVRVHLAEADDAARGSRSGAPAARDDEWRGLALLRYGALVLAALPLVTFVATLIPWWRSTLPGLALTPVLVALAAAVVSIVLAEPWRSWTLGPAAALAGLTAVVLGLDAATGSSLQVDALLGVGHQDTGRIAGFSDMGGALFVTGALVVGVALADWLWRGGRARRAPMAVLLLGLVCGVTAVLPGLGASLGALLTLVPGFLVLVAAAAGRRFSALRAVVVLGVTALVVAALGMVDAQRHPSDQTRLGRFVTGLGDGTAWRVVARKADDIAGTTLTDPLGLVVLLVIAFLAVVALRRVPGGEGTPLEEVAVRPQTARWGLVAIATSLVVGVVASASATAVPGMGLLLAGPLLVAAMAQQRLAAIYGLERPLLAGRDAPAPSHGEAGERPVRRPGPTWADAAREQSRGPVA